jgi:protein phosphatase
MDEKKVAPNTVYCNKCGLGNPNANKFCFDCGNSLLSSACSYCGQANPHFANFCGSCGHKLKTKA